MFFPKPFEPTARRPRFTVASLALAAALALAACGGGGGDDDDTGAPVTPPTGSAVGVFTDAPVAGLSYTASPSGVTGVTNAAGEFSYNPGDQVTFSLGGLELGVADGAATVTPADIGGNADVVNNLLVLLQSLDTDADAATITLPSTLAADGLSGVDLTLAPAEFADAALNTALAAALPAGGAIVSPEAAKQHAIDFFWSQAAGVWLVSPEGEDSPSYIRLQPNVDHDGDPATPPVTAYLLGDIGAADDDDDGGPGYETGIVGWDPLTGRLSVQVDAESNGDWGLSESVPATLKLEGGQLRFVETYAADDVFEAVLTRVDDDAAGLVGTWVIVGDDGLPLLRTQTFVFTADNRYVMIDPLGDTDGNACGGPGVEAGGYSFSDGVLQVNDITQDTNGCAGLYDSTPGGGGAVLALTLSDDGRTLTASEDGEVVATLKRVSD